MSTAEQSSSREGANISQSAPPVHPEFAYELGRFYLDLLTRRAFKRKLGRSLARIDDHLSAYGKGLARLRASIDLQARPARKDGKRGLR